MWAQEGPQISTQNIWPNACVRIEGFLRHPNLEPPTAKINWRGRVVSYSNVAWSAWFIVVQQFSLSKQFTTRIGDMPILGSSTSICAGV